MNNTKGATISSWLPVLRARRRTEVRWWRLFLIQSLSLKFFSRTDGPGHTFRSSLMTILISKSRRCTTRQGVVSSFARSLASLRSTMQSMLTIQSGTTASSRLNQVEGQSVLFATLKLLISSLMQEFQERFTCSTRQPKTRMDRSRDTREKLLCSGFLTSSTS